MIVPSQLSGAAGLLAALLLGACGPGLPTMPPAPASALAVSSIRADSDQRFSSLLAASPDPRIFVHYDSAGRSLWARNFTRRLNFTGVAWDDNRTATLVSPEHVIMAGHHSRPAGATLVFHDLRGNPHSRTLSAVEPLGFADVAVGRLDAPLPASVKPYRLLPPSDGYGSLAGCLAVVTDQHRNAFIHEVAGFQGTTVVFRRPDSSRIPPTLVKSLVSGDSGNPSFLLVGGELALLETHTTGGPGAGPCYASPQVFTAVNAAMAKLGGGRQLQVVPIAGGR